MTGFVLSALLLCAAALAFVLPALLRARARSDVSRDAVNVAVYRDQLRELEADRDAGLIGAEHYERARRELEARLLAEIGEPAAPPSRPRPRTALALGIALPACAVAVYLLVGNPQALLPDGGTASAQHALGERELEAAVEGLAARLKDRPEDQAGWALLGRSYMVLGRFREAADAYARAVERAPRDAQLLADYADALAMAQGRRLAGEPEQIIGRALAADPDNVKALALAGSAAFERADYTAAARHWERILELVSADSELARSIRASIAEARSRAGAAPARGRVSGTVRLAPELAAKAGGDDTVFIFARAVDGPRAPLAVLRKRVHELPAAFTLDDTMAMNPARKLSDFQKVVVGARISRSASPTPRPGDLEGRSAPVAVGAERVNVVIDTELR